jgi:hypothetical protein
MQAKIEEGRRNLLDGITL